MSELPDEIKLIAPDIHWDEKRDTFYIQQRGGSCPDMPGQMHRFRQMLEEAPNNQALRFVLAQFLLGSNQCQEAQSELQQVAQSGEMVWAAKAQQLLDTEFSL